MAPRETEALPCGPSSLAQLKVFDKALQLPVVSDVASKLASHQLKGVVEGMSSLVTQAEESLPARLRHCSDTAKEKVGSAVEGLDSLACDGLDQLTNNIPALKGTSSELCEVTKDAVYSYLERTKDYLASFTVAQKALLLGDRALQATSDAVKYIGLGNKVEVKSALETVDALRRSARAACRAGARAAEVIPVETIGEASLVGAVAEILGVNYFLSYVGLKIVPAHLLKKETTDSLESSVEEESVEEKLSDEKMANYKSDEDPDFEPCEHTAEDEEDEIVEISDEDEEIQVVEVIGVEASIHRTKNEDFDEFNEIQVIDVVGVETKPKFIKIEDDNSEEMKDEAAIQLYSAAKDIECVEIVDSVEVEAPKEMSFDQLLEFHKAEQEKAKLESLVSWSADALTEQLESASAALGEKVFKMGGEEYLVLSEENAAEIVSVPKEVKDPLAHRVKQESDDGSSEEEAVAEEDEVDDVQVIDEYDPLADAIGAMNMAEDKSDDDDDIEEVSSDSEDSNID